MQATPSDRGSPLAAADHRLAESPQRVAQRVILDIGEAPVKDLPLGRGERARPRWRRLGRPRRWALLQGQPRHRVVAEEGVDALDQHRLAMLDLGAEAGRDGGPCFSANRATAR